MAGRQHFYRSKISSDNLDDTYIIMLIDHDWPGDTDQHIMSVARGTLLQLVGCLCHAPALRCCDGDLGTRARAAAICSITPH